MTRRRTPVIFLIGPPGVGKTTLGQRACARLGLELSDPGEVVDAAAVEGLTEHGADVVALPWSAQQSNDILTAARRAGEVLLLWAHPLKMQSRSGRHEPLFTPSARLTTAGGFGRKGTACREFRRLDRAAAETAILVGMDLDEATDVLTDYLVYLRELPTHPIEVRAGLGSWADGWQREAHAEPDAAAALVDAMARYVIELEASGTSPRSLNAVRSDLFATGLLVFMYEQPKAQHVLSCFSGVPWELEFKRKFTDRPRLVARYRKSVLGFSAFLQRAGPNART